MVIKYIELFLLVVISLFTDMRESKIKNKVLVVFLAAGIITNAYYNGIGGMAQSLLGVVVPFVILILFFGLGMLGAGDIKLFCVIGAIMGANYVINNITYSLLSGGAIVFVLMLKRGILGKRLKYAYLYFYNLTTSGQVMPYANFSAVAEKEKFKFTYAIAAGVIVQLIAKGIFGGYFF